MHFLRKSKQNGRVREKDAAASCAKHDAENQAMALLEVLRAR
jgi:hypothetical protein